MDKIKILKGMHDILPQEVDFWITLEKLLYDWINSYAYKQIRTPILENTLLFKRSIGDDTDVIGKEMYSFIDLDNTSISLRPEGTASCLRSVIENNLLYNAPQKIWYMGSMFRHEKPQKGRFRQFHQLGVEALGFDSFDIDVEIIEMVHNLWCKLELVNNVQLQINSLGNKEERDIYKKELVNYFKKYESNLDSDSKRKLHTNPLRILDSKNPDIQNLCNNVPLLINYLSEESLERYYSIKHFLSKLNIKYVENYKLVRGLDYYNHIVFEWTSNNLGITQSAICAGGRYDGLIKDLGGGNYSGIGFALGIERLLLLLDYHNNNKIFKSIDPDIYIISKNINEKIKSMEYASELRRIGYNVYYHCGLQKIHNQFKKADLSKARFAIIIGEKEFLENSVTIKDLRGNLGQLTVSKDEYVNLINHWMKK